MASSFMGLYVQRDALLLSQKALDITGNNISNIHTTGYTRQRVDVCSIANARGTLGYNTSVTLAGKGSKAIGVAQVRDMVLDRQVRDHSADLCNFGVKVSVLSDVEDLFDSIESDANLDYLDAASLTSILSKLKSAMQSFSSDNADRTEMANIVINTAKSLAQSVNNINQKLDDIANQSITDVNSTIDRINTIFSEMGQLNEQIKNAYVAMGYITKTNNNYQVMNEYGPLELKDEMNNLLDELSQYGNISVKEETDGTFTVTFAGQLVVEGKKYAQMAMTETEPRPGELSFVITKAERNDKGEIVGGLYDKDDWYNLHISNRTGGNGQDLVRMAMKEYIGMKGEDLDVVNITGQRSNGSQYLDSGSLRGYLDVFNGRGVYADDAYVNGLSAENRAAFQEKLDAANEALGKLAGDPTDDVLSDIAEKLKAIGAQFQFDAEAHTYKVTINDVVIYEKVDGALLTDKGPLTLGEDENLNGVVMTNDNQAVMTVSDAYQSTQRQVDLANNALQYLQEHADSFPLPTDILNELIETLSTSIGAKFRIDAQTGDYAVPYIVEVNGIVIFDGTTAKALKLRNPDAPASVGNVEIYAEWTDTELQDKMGKKTEIDDEGNEVEVDVVLSKGKISVANEALKKLEDAIAAAKAKNKKSLDAGVLNEIAKDLKNSLGAEITGEKLDDYKVVLNGVTIFENGKADQISSDYDRDEYGNVIFHTEADDPADAKDISSKGDTVRSITSNTYQGVEYYRDMLNAFVKTLTEEFNKVYTGVDVQTEAAATLNKNVAQANAYIRELAKGNVGSGREDIIKKALEDMFGEDNVSFVPDGNGNYTVKIYDEEVLNTSDEVTELRIVTLQGPPEQSQLMIGDAEVSDPVDNFVKKNYEMFNFDYDNFRRAAETFRVSDDWLLDPMFISDPTKDNVFDELDNIYINKLLGIFSEDATGKLTYGDGFGHGEANSFTLEKYIDHISGNLGDQISNTNYVYSVMDIVLTGYEEDRSGVMDVSMNEEGISMMNYQKWYNAISRMVSTMDEALDKLINQTGLVGLR